MSEADDQQRLWFARDDPKEFARISAEIKARDAPKKRIERATPSTRPVESGKTAAPKRRALSPKKRVAIYIRVSTEEQGDEGMSLQNQERRCRAFAEAQGWEVVAVYRDEASGLDQINRPGYTRMMSERGGR
jgi:predicted site-specific integrase-resolvase